ncbi:MAG: hypothetical protein NTX52_10890, partial [Planctomycetota bacterium]|nr:hypothetical protein [Planctomycetota bacterium]
IAYCYGYGQRTFIAIRKKRGPAVSTGVDVRVFEQSSGGLLGEFRILNEIDGHYVCELVGYMDALWMGYVKQVGSQHSIPPPEALAWVLVKNIGETNERSEEQN